MHSDLTRMEAEVFELMKQRASKNERIVCFCDLCAHDSETCDERLFCNKRLSIRSSPLPLHLVAA